MIQISNHDPCDFGCGGSICGYHHQQVEAERDNHNYDVDEIVEVIETELIYGDNETGIFEEVVDFAAKDRSTSALDAV